MSAFTNHFAFEFKTGLRNTNQLFIIYLFPLAVYLLLAALMPKINPGFLDTMVPAMVVFAVLASNILGLPSPIVESREAGIFRSFKINGVPATSIISIPIISNIFHSVIVSGIITATAIAFFKGQAPSDWLAFGLITLLTAFTCASLGALIGVISANTRATVLWSQLIFLPSMLIGGLMLPLTLIPEGFRPFSALLPTSHAMQAYLGLAYGLEALFDPWISMGVLLTSGLLAFALAVYLFNWDSRNKAQRGHPLMALIAFAPYVISIFLL